VCSSDLLASLVSFEAQKLSAALLLACPYVPLLFMGQEYGETRPFLYFVSHGDAALVEAVRAGRRSEFGHFSWQGEIPDPQALETFERSRLDRAAITRPAHAAVLRLHEDLLRLRREERALWDEDATTKVEAGDGWIATRRELPGRGLLGLFNLAPEERNVEVHADGTWRAIVTTDDERYGGKTRMPAEAVTAKGTFRVMLGPSSAILYRRVSG